MIAQALIILLLNHSSLGRLSLRLRRLHGILRLESEVLLDLDHRLVRETHGLEGAQEHRIAHVHAFYFLLDFFLIRHELFLRGSADQDLAPLVHSHWVDPHDGQRATEVHSGHEDGLHGSHNEEVGKRCLLAVRPEALRDALNVLRVLNRPVEHQEVVGHKEY